MKKITPLVVILFATISCQSLKTLNKNSYNAVPTRFDDIKMEVRGVDGWLPGRNIKYGNYNALKIKRAATKGYSLSFFPKINKNVDLTKKTRFTQIAANGNKANIYILQEYSKRGIVFDINEYIEYDNTSVVNDNFSGKIIIDDNNIWNFIINSKTSLAKNLKGDEINIKSTNYGYVFLINDKEIAGYATGVFKKNWAPLANYAWIKSNINEEKKIILASLITSLIGRESIDD
jgi:hypothetical protein